MPEKTSQLIVGLIFRVVVLIATVWGFFAAGFEWYPDQLFVNVLAHIAAIGGTIYVLIFDEYSGAIQG